jgi:hypothetical protein
MEGAIDHEAVEGDMDQEAVERAVDAVEASIDVTGRKHMMMIG